LSVIRGTGGKGQETEDERLRTRDEGKGKRDGRKRKKGRRHRDVGRRREEGRRNKEKGASIEQISGRTVSEGRRYLFGSFDALPRNIIS